MVAFLSGLGALQGLFLSALLLARKGRAYGAVAGLLAVTAISLALDAAEAEGLLSRFIWMVPLELLAIVMIAPLLDTSIIALMHGRVRVSPAKLVYGFLCGCLMVPLLTVDPEQASELLAGEVTARLDVWSLVAVFSATLLIVIPAVALLIVILRGRLRVGRALEADSANPGLQLLRASLNLIALLWFAWVASLIFEPLFAPAPWPLSFGALAMATGIYVLGWIGLQHPAALSASSDQFAGKIVRVVSGRYLKSAITEADVSRLETRLDDAMRAGNLHRDPSLTLPQLARAVNASANDVSRVLNEGGTGFFDYVNSWRIAEARELLVTDPEARIVDIAFDVGFNAKSTFNAAFRKQCGITPSQFRAQLLV